MTYNVYQHWDPLKVCMVGKSYEPEFYSFIKNSKVRNVLERIAQETEEDYQKLIKLLERFGVKILRPDVSDDHTLYLDPDTGIIASPPMTPRDYSAMIGNKFYFDLDDITGKWNIIRGADWPEACPDTWEDIPDWIQKELKENFNLTKADFNGINYNFKNVVKQISSQCELVLNQDVNSAMVSRIGRDLYVGTWEYGENPKPIHEKYTALFPDYRIHIVDTGGHSDGTYCPVVPGLIVSLFDVPTYKETFPDWEVVYLPGQSWDMVKPFLDIKEKNKGKWWVPGEELNDEFTNFVETWLTNWVGFVEETVFDVNMLVIDEKNVVCNGYNEQVFKAFDRYGVTPHIINFRHRYFWDGGLHCITSDIHREGTLKDYFPERG